MAKTDRSRLLSNDQDFGQIADPNKIEDSIEHAYDTIDENDEGFNNHKQNAILDHPDKSVTEVKLGDKSVSRRTIQKGAVGADELDDALVNYYGDMAVKAKLDELQKRVFGVVNVKEYNTVQEAIDHAISIQAPYNLFNGSYSSGLIEINFGGDCETDIPVALPKCGGLIFSNGTLRASDNFVGDFVFKFIEPDPQAYLYLFFNNFHLDGNRLASCIMLDKFSRVFFNQVTVTKYTDFGVKVGDTVNVNAHELIVNGLFIGQYEWNDPDRPTATKTGVAMQVNTPDNHFSNITIFSGLKGLEINKEFNQFNNVHVWGCEDRDNAVVVNAISPVTFDQCYFDGAALKIKNPYDISLTNSFFLCKPATKPSAFILFETMGGGSKMIRYLNITGNRFKNNADVPVDMINLIESDGTFNLGETIGCEIKGNSNAGTNVVNMTYSEITISKFASNASSRVLDFTNELKLTNLVKVIGHYFNDTAGKTPITSVSVSGNVVTHKLNSDTVGTSMNSNGTAFVTATINKQVIQ
jgi:hypothetical protein